MTNNIIRGTRKSLDLASIFCVYPHKTNNLILNFIIEVASTIVFMISLMYINNRKHKAFFYNLITPILTGIIVMIINMLTYSFNAVILNPAIDLSPRICLILLGWGNIIFTGGFNFPYFLIPLLGSILGINLGGIIYNTIKKK